MPSAMVSLAIILAGFGLYFYQGGFRFSVDFTGGTEVRLRFKSQEDTAAIREAIKKEWDGSIYNLVEHNELIIRVQQTPDTIKDLDKKIKATVDAVSPDNPAEILQTNSLSSSVGQALRWKSTQAILIALIAMLLYISLRFQFAFALGAVVALFHDALAILACFLFFNKEISIDVIGAILATLGYSINDTIVIFTKIRENLVKHGSMNLEDVVEQSIQSTMRRTMLTSLSTALVVGSQFAFGGETIRGLSLALLLGIIFGTYSSIFIASSVMMLFHKKNA